MSFSKNLEKLVKEGWNFLRMLDNCNIEYSRDFIWRKELPTSSELSKLSKYLNVPADELLDGKISSTLNKDEAKLIILFRKIPEEKQREIINHMESISNNFMEVKHPRLTIFSAINDLCKDEKEANKCTIIIKDVKTGVTYYEAKYKKFMGFILGNECDQLKTLKDEFNINLKKGFQHFKVVKGEREVSADGKLTNRIVIAIM